MWVEMDADEAAESYNAEFLGQHEVSRLQQCERHMMAMMALVQDGTQRCAMVRDAGSCCNNVEVREGALANGKGNFSIRGTLAQQRGQSWEISYFSVTELQCNSGHHDAA